MAKRIRRRKRINVTYWIVGPAPTREHHTLFVIEDQKRMEAALCWTDAEDLLAKCAKANAPESVKTFKVAKPSPPHAKPAVKAE